MLRIDIPKPILDQISERLQNGEQWLDVCAAFGYGKTAVRSNLARHNMQCCYGRVSPVRQKVASDDRKGPRWADTLSQAALTRPMSALI